MPRFAREELLAKFRRMMRARQPIVGGGAGTGLSAKCEEAGGIDLIVIYNSGRYRMAGRGSLSGLLAYGNANDVVMEMAKEVLPVVCATSTICLRIIPASRKVSSRATAPATRSDAYEF